MLGLGGIAKKVFGTANDRKVKSTQKTVDRINALEPEFAALSDADILARTETLKARARGGRDAGRPAARGLRQLPGGRAPRPRASGLRRAAHGRDIPARGQHLGDEDRRGQDPGGDVSRPISTRCTGRGVHIVTVNDYLAKRDSEWMGKVYGALGMTVGRDRIRSQPDEREARRLTSADITYATNNELGFDYLRDNMRVSNCARWHQRDHYYAIVDEVDSILIDEARTPLDHLGAVAGPLASSIQEHRRADPPSCTDEHYELDEKTAQRHLQRGGQRLSGGRGCSRPRGSCRRGSRLYDPESTTVVHHVNQGLQGAQAVPVGTRTISSATARWC